MTGQRVVYSLAVMRTCMSSLLLVAFGTHLVGAEVALKVGLFPWVPNRDKMEAVVASHWEKLHPNVALEFVEWDCYSADPPGNLDVFETDAIFLDHIVAGNYATALDLTDIEDLDDVMPFAVKGSMVNGQLYGIPRIACTPVLFYRKGDVAIRDAASLDEIFSAIGYSNNTKPEPPVNAGLLVSLDGGTTDACLFLDAIADISNEYSTRPTLPGADDLDEDALATVRMLAYMAGRHQALYEDWTGARARWFADGKGQALIGWTERLAHMPLAAHSEVEVRELPLESHLMQGNTDARTGEAARVNLFFVDTICVNSLLTGRKRELAIEFAQLASSPTVVKESFLVKNDKTGSPQYLLPVRKSVIGDEDFLKAAPLYSKLWKFYQKNPLAFRMGHDSRVWLRSVKGEIRRLVTDIPPYTSPSGVSE